MTQGVTRRNQHTYTLTILVTPMNPGRLGIYGGTFNPIHTGHLIIAQEIYEQCKLDRLLFIPSARPPQQHGCSDRLLPHSVDGHNIMAPHGCVCSEF